VPDGYNSAVIDGGNSVTTFFSPGSAVDVTWNGIKVQRFTRYIFGQSANAATGWTIENSDLGNGGSGGGLGVGFSYVIGGSSSWNITNNHVHDWQNAGITTFAFNSGDNTNGAVIQNNFVERTCTREDDCGGIYISMRATGDAGGSVTVKNNFCRNTGGTSGQHSLRCYYLDDNTSNTTVTGNISGPLSTSISTQADGFANCFFVHNGNNNELKNNLCDLGATSNESSVGYGFDRDSLTGMAGQAFTNNIVISGYAGSSSVVAYGFQTNLSTSDFTISNNGYHNFSTGTPNTSGAVKGDTSPQLYNARQIGVTCPNGVYAITNGSTVTRAPVNFPLLPTSWGPPGFTIPASANHSC
jgi:hypothetical protein